MTSSRDSKDSPHLLQAMAKGCERSRVGLPRVLATDAKCVSYRRRKGELKSVLHWGQRKLLMSEIEFLTNFAEGSCKTLVYAGMRMLASPPLQTHC